jgi:hypothetical protein
MIPSVRSEPRFARAGRAIALGACLAAACVPGVEPSWVITQPRELALHMEVAAQGPYGLPIDPAGPSGSEFLPRDTVRATPFIAGPDGPIDPEELDILWALCRDPGGCRTASPDPDLPACDLAVLVPEDPCELGSGASIELRLGDPPAPGPEGALDVSTTVPVLSMIASAPDGPGARACVERLAARRSLAGCMLMERSIALGPLSEIIDLLERLGYEIDLGESLEPLLDRPRNHNPGVPRFAVHVGDGMQEVESGGRASVRVGDHVLIEVLPRESDVETFEIEIDGLPLDVQETLNGRWWTDTDVEGFSETLSGLAVRWDATKSGPVTFFFVLRDDRGSEVGGWLGVDVGT